MATRMFFRSGSLCSIAECGRGIASNSARGMCRRHYRLWLKYGDPHVSKRELDGAGSAKSSPYVRGVNWVKNRKYVHREVMERVLGRPLLRSEHVHHRDGNKRNNHPSNLEIVTPTEHAQIHGPMRGLARKNALTPEQRSELSRRAITAFWQKHRERPIDEQIRWTKWRAQQRRATPAD